MHIHTYTDTYRYTHIYTDAHTHIYIYIYDKNVYKEKKCLWGVQTQQRPCRRCFIPGTTILRTCLFLSILLLSLALPLSLPFEKWFSRFITNSWYFCMALPPALNLLKCTILASTERVTSYLSLCAPSPSVPCSISWCVFGLYNLIHAA